jgi:hypothetical protein
MAEWLKNKDSIVSMSMQEAEEADTKTIGFK